jgi:integrase/recombinase XerD
MVYYLGLKSSEVIQLKISDLDLKKKKLKVPSLKVKGEYKLLSLVPELEELLQSYLKNIPQTVWLFPGKPANKQYSIRSLQRLFTDTATRLGITKVITPITIRRSRAVELKKAGYDWKYIKEFLGHSGKDTTKRFYRELSKS